MRVRPDVVGHGATLAQGVERVGAPGRGRSRSAAPPGRPPTAPGPRAARWAGAGSPGAAPVGTSPHATGALLGPRRTAADGRVPGASLRSRPMTSPQSCRRRPTRCTGTTPSTWATASSPRATAPRTTGPSILPDVAGRSVLDIGAWDGKYSFLAEQAGASRVVALDHYAWGVDFAARGAYWAECIQNGTLPDQSRDETDFWQPDLPGRRGLRAGRGRAGVEGRAAGGRLPDRRPRRARAVRRRALPRRAVPHEGAADLPRAGACRHQGGGRHRDRGGAPAGPRRRGAAAVPRRQLAAHRLRELVRADDRGAAQPVPGGRLLRGAHRRRAARAPAGAAPRRRRSAWDGGSPASRRRRRRRPARTTAPSSTPTSERPTDRAGGPPVP